MLMGFISLLLAVGQTPISKICIPAKAGSIMLPCKPPKGAAAAADDDKSDGRRRLLWYPPYPGYDEPGHHRRFLAGAAPDDNYCSDQVRPRPGHHSNCCATQRAWEEPAYY
jgi:mlo protein